MEQAARVIVETLFRALESRDMAAALDTFAEDAVIFDPHYPTPQMSGREAIGEGLAWGLSVMKSFGFRTVRFYGFFFNDTATTEIYTNHVLNTGQELSFPQAFFVETRDGKIAGLRAYEPYGPNGLGGFFLGLERLKRRIVGRR